MHVVNTKVIPKIERKFDHLTFLDFRLQNEHFIELKSGVGFQKSIQKFRHPFWTSTIQPQHQNCQRSPIGHNPK